LFERRRASHARKHHKGPTKGRSTLEVQRA
jgi:hypothetical protein